MHGAGRGHLVFAGGCSQFWQVLAEVQLEVVFLLAVYRFKTDIDTVTCGLAG
jgi:hypothetical protein